MGEHVCRCQTCTPDERLSGPRLGPNHFAVRFGHTGRQFIPTLDGESVVYAFEHLTGDRGWVAFYTSTEIDGRSSRHICQRCWYDPLMQYTEWELTPNGAVPITGNRGDACYEIREGRVEMPDLVVSV